MELHANHFNRIISLGCVGGGGGGGRGRSLGGFAVSSGLPQKQKPKPKTETETETPSGMRRTDPDPLAEDTDVNLDSELTRVQLTTTAESLISRALEIACE